MHFPGSKSGKKFKNHSASVSVDVTSDPSFEGKTPGGIELGGKRIHFFEPFITTFHALAIF